eukprot:5796082-Amphidinium_carterae.1
MLQSIGFMRTVFGLLPEGVPGLVLPQHMKEMWKLVRAAHRVTHMAVRLDSKAFATPHPQRPQGLWHKLSNTKQKCLSNVSDLGSKCELRKPSVPPRAQ